MYDVIIAGAGVVGCAAAQELSKYQLRVLVLEKENDVAMGTSRANTAILHAGYDPEPGTTLARLNVRGSQLARELCRELQVPWAPVPSMVAACGEEQDRHVRMLYERGLANGVPDLSVLTGKEARRMEPNLSDEVTSVLLARSAAVVDPMRYTIALARSAAANGVEFRFSTPVTSFEKEGEELVINRAFRTRCFVNCAGLGGDEVSALTGDVHEIRPVGGAYCLLDKSEGTRVSATVFPCPTEKGKGIVVTPTVHGNLLVGPTAHKQSDKYDTSTDGEHLSLVKAEAKKYVKGLDFSKNIRVFAGVRAYSEQSDFIIGPGSTGGVFHAIGIKSPGLTAAPAIAEDLAEMVIAYLGGAPRDPDYRLQAFVSPFTHAGEEEKDELIRRRPSYGRIICRCEQVTQGEMEDQMSFPLPPTTVDGMKRRTGSGMGRCQGGFCMPRVHEILSVGNRIPMEEVCKDAQGSVILKGGRLK